VGPVSFETRLKSDRAVQVKEEIKRTLKLKRRRSEANYEYQPLEVADFECRFDSLLTVDYSGFYKNYRRSSSGS
jgi:hypothetical protein